MKKILIAIIVCVLLLASTSCAPHETDQAPINQNDYLFAVSNNTVYKYNIKSGIASPLCGDPLCKHSNDRCPFYGVGEEIFKLNNTIVYDKENKILKYDLSTNKSEVAYTAEGNIYYPYLIEDSIYFNTVTFDYSPDANHPTSVDLLCFSFSNNNVKSLNGEKLYDMQRIQGIDGDRIVWYDNGLQLLYTTNYDYNERTSLNEEYYGIIAGGKSYRLKVASTSPISFDLYGHQNGEDVTALHGIVSIKGYHDLLIATYNSKDGKYIGQAIKDDGSLMDVIEYQGNELYVYDSDGNNERKLCSIPDDYIIYSLAPTKITMSNGDYIGVQLKEYEFDAKGYVIGYKAATNIAIINVNTGICVITKGK